MEKYMIFDTETTNSLEDPFVYDLGFAIIDKEGNIYETRSFVNADIFLDKQLMSSAFFIDKIPIYWEDIQKGNRIMKRWYNIRKEVRESMMKWDIHDVIAHNARFDYRSTAYTQRFLTSSKYRYFFPYGTHIIDTLKMSRQVFKIDSYYQKWCIDNHYLTSRNEARYTAEILYRYLINNHNFEESHTALEDVMIEKEIFVECLRRCPTIDGHLW